MFLTVFREYGNTSDFEVLTQYQYQYPIVGIAQYQYQSFNTKKSLGIDNPGTNQYLPNWAYGGNVFNPMTL